MVAACGWLVDSRALRTLFIDASPMQPNTLLGLLALAIGMVGAVRGVTWLARAAWVGLCIGLGTFVVGLVAPGARFDFAWATHPDVHRMAPSTSLSIALVAFATLGIAAKRDKHWAPHGALMVSLLISLTVLISYSYGLTGAQQVPFLSTMSFPTALCLAVLALGLFAATPQGRFTALFHQPTATSQLLRRLVLLAAPMPWLLGLLALSLQRAFETSTPVALALVASGSMAFLCAGIVNLGAIASRRERDLGITLDSIGDAVLVTDARGRVVRLNPVAEALTGWSLAEAAGRPVKDVFRIINEDTRVEVESPVDRVLRDGVVVGLANHTLLVHRDGSERPIADSGAPVRDPEGTMRGVVLVFRDMTDEARARRELEDSVAVLTRVMDLVPVGLQATHAGRGVYANPAMLKLYGMERLDEFVGADLFQLVRPESRAAMQHRHAKWKEGELPAPIRVEIKARDGKTVVLDSQPLATDVTMGGQRVQLAMVQRVSDREALALRTARESAWAMVGAELSRELMDARFDLEKILRTITRLAGPGKGEISFVRLVTEAGDHLQPVTALWSEVSGHRPIVDYLAVPSVLGPTSRMLLQSEGPVVFDTATLLASVPGPLKALLEANPPLIAAAVPMRAQGRHVGLLVIGRPVERPFDADDLRHAQDLADRGAQAVVTAQLFEQMAKARARAEETSERLKATEAQLQHSQKLDALGRLAGGVAHDFNNLLSVVLSLSDLMLADRAPDDPERRDLEDIRSAGTRAAELTRQLLAFSRKQVMQLKPLSVNQVIEENRAIVTRLLGEDVKLTIELEPGVPPVRGDPALLSQVLINLAVNSRDAMPTGGRLVVRTRTCDVVALTAPEGLEPGPHVCIDVEDEGTGMSSEVMERVFEPFFTTKPRGKGTGLGLSTSYGIVRQSGGTMTVRSEPGMGTVFTAWLPVVDAPLPAPEPRRTTSTEMPRSAVVFLVEDETQVREVAQRVLSRAGYTVVAAGSAEEALERAKTLGAVDLLLTDVVMPGLSGRELADELTRARPGLKVLFMSGYTADAVVQRGVFDAHISLLQKPFTPESLLRAVEKSLTQS